MSLYRSIDTGHMANIQSGPKKGKPPFGGHFEILPGVINLSVYLFGKCRYFNASGEEIEARMSLLRILIVSSVKSYVGDNLLTHPYGQREISSNLLK